MFAPWRRLATTVDVRPVQYPGRENRTDDAPARGLADLADEAARAVLAEDAGAVVLFGHSMGGIVALETARRLVAAGAPVTHLVVSAALPPESQAARTPRSGLPAEDLLDEYVALGGFPPELLEHPDLAERALEVLRADLALVEGARPTPGTVPCPITVFRGADDLPEVASAAAGWDRCTEATCSHREFRGGHFYLLDRAQEVVDALEASVAATGPTPFR